MAQEENDGGGRPREALQTTTIRRTNKLWGLGQEV